MPQTNERRGRIRRFLPWLSAAVVALVLPLAACQDVLDVDDPDIVTPGNLLDEAGLQTLRNGALGNFALAWAGGGFNDGQVMISGLMTDEWMHSGTFPTRQEVELRSIPTDNSSLAGLYLRLQQARSDLENAAGKIEEAVPDPTAEARIPELLAYAGYTYLAFGENYCSGVPFSLAPDTGALVFGEPETTTQIFQRAVAHFDAVLAHAAVPSSIADLARVGKGRALLNLDQPAAAATAVASVPYDYVRYTEHSNNSTREQNPIYELNYQERRWSVADREGINGLDFRSSGDPRVNSVLDSRGGFDGASELWHFTHFQYWTDRVALATGIEARLIEAEADLRAGDVSSWLGILNQLRTDFATLAPILYPDNPPSGTLAPLADPGTSTAREDLHFRERAFWLYSTNHRLGDLRRLIRQYGRSADSVFPTGPYFKGGESYATDVNLPIPEEEENNPYFGQCLDRNP
ncbi:MAG: hypothetical protein GTN62_09875 [Gemmatimonadales bacterium]|nr:hypothetical protein [Gemmatimonadales bacterium]NIP07867.1 hypothetical protein [Gemmatimonadales bacterium]